MEIARSVEVVPDCDLDALAPKVQEAWQELDRSAKRTFEAGWLLGNLLVPAKEKLKSERKWLSWLEGVLEKDLDDVSQRKVFYCVSIREKFPNLQSLQGINIPPSSFNELAARWVPEEAIAEVREASQGSRLSGKGVKEILNKYKAPKDAQTAVEIQEAYANVGDVATPKLEQIQELYLSLGYGTEIIPLRKGFGVQNTAFQAKFDSPFPLRMYSREQAWRYWQEKGERLHEILRRHLGGESPEAEAPKMQISIPVPRFESEPHPAGVIASAKSCERYTPSNIWQAGLKCFGIKEFDLDPASHSRTEIPCKQIFTKHENGLAQVWRAKYLWSNFPYSDINPETGKKMLVMDQWVEKFCLEYECGNVENALTLVKSDCRPAWFNQLLTVASGMCFIRGAVKFEVPESDADNGSFFGSVVFYLGDRYSDFSSAYESLGICQPLGTAAMLQALIEEVDDKDLRDRMVQYISKGT